MANPSRAERQRDYRRNRAVVNNLPYLNDIGEGYIPINVVLPPLGEVIPLFGQEVIDDPIPAPINNGAEDVHADVAQSSDSEAPSPAPSEDRYSSDGSGIGDGLAPNAFEEVPGGLGHLSDTDHLAVIQAHHGATHSHTKSILQYLRMRTNLHVPSDSRTVMGTTRIPIRDKGFHYIDQALEKGISMQMNTGFNFEDGIIRLELSIDGIPVFKSPPTGFWPILCRVLNTNDSYPFLCGAYCGASKPPNLEAFLEPIIENIMQLQIDGISINRRHYDVQLRRVICDVPARAFVKCTKGHSGYNACERCNQRGEKILSRMTFPLTDPVDFVLRSDASFRNQDDPEHHSGDSPFLAIDALDMVFDFPLDYLHLVLLGVMRKLLKIWAMGLATSPYVINADGKRRINRKLMKIRKYLTAEFERRSVSLSHLGTWKGQEFRTFLLYTGPFLLKGILSPEKFNHFLKLHVAIRILASPGYLDNNELAHDLLVEFVEQFATIYGDHHIVFNVHNLIHLAEECRRNGPLDSWSAFVYESYLGRLTKLIRSKNRPLAQLIRRYSELYHLRRRGVFVPRGSKKNKPILQTIKLGSRADSICLLSDGSIARVSRITDGIIKGRKYRNLNSFYSVDTDTYEEAIPSTQVKIYSTTGLANHSTRWNRHDHHIVSKCMVFSYHGDTMIVPHIHQSG